MTFKVYEAIAAVQGELAKHGISKDRENAQQGYNFRGIDDVYTALSPLLAKHKLSVIPRVLTREVSDRQTKSGSINFNVAVHAAFVFVSAEDGSKPDIGRASCRDRGCQDCEMSGVAVSL